MRPELRSTVAVLACAAWVGGAAMVLLAWPRIGRETVGGAEAMVVLVIAAGAIGFGMLGARAVERNDADARGVLAAVEAHVRRLESQVRRLDDDLCVMAERRAASETALRDVEESHLRTDRSWRRARRVLASASEGAMGIGDDGRVEWANAEACRILEVGEDDPPPTGRTVSAVARDEQVASVMADAWLAGASVTREVSLVPLVVPDPPSRYGASPRIVRVTAVPFVDESEEDGGAPCEGLPGVIYLFDETERRRADTIRRDFVANVTHELRTPLTSLKAIVETLEEGAIDDPDARQEFLRLMHDEVDSLTQLVLGALDLSLIESGQAPVNRVPVAPMPLLNSALRRLRTQATRSGIELRLAAEDGLPPIHADPMRIGEVLLNLVQNSIKFTPRDGVITMTAARDPLGVRFAVADTGVGVAPDEVVRLFERFYKADRSRASGGTGLGLAIAKHIVQVHGGTIGAESDGEGRGTTIWFTVPTAAPSASDTEEDLVNVAPSADAVAAPVVDEMPTEAAPAAGGGRGRRGRGGDGTR